MQIEQPRISTVVPHEENQQPIAERTRNNRLASVLLVRRMLAPVEAVHQVEPPEVERLVAPPVARIAIPRAVVGEGRARSEAREHTTAPVLARPEAVALPAWEAGVAEVLAGEAAGEGVKSGREAKGVRREINFQE